MKTFRRIGGGVLALSFLHGCFLNQLDAQPVVYQATGTREQVQAVADAFKHDIIYGPSGSEQSPPAYLGRYYVATFDDLASSSTTTPFRVSLTSGGVNIMANVFGGTLLVRTLHIRALIEGTYLSVNGVDPSQ